MNNERTGLITIIYANDNESKRGDDLPNPGIPPALAGITHAEAAAMKQAGLTLTWENYKKMMSITKL